MTEPSITRLLCWPNRRAALGVFVLAVVVAAICWYFGADVWHSILLGAAIAAITVAASAGAGASAVQPTVWREERYARPRGARHDVTSLASSLRQAGGGIGYRADERLRRLARRRLARHHLDIESPADGTEIARLLGRRAQGLLVRNDRRPMHLRSFRHCLDALDALDPPSQPPPDQRRLPSLPVRLRQGRTSQR